MKMKPTSNTQPRMKPSKRFKIKMTINTKVTVYWSNGHIKILIEIRGLPEEGLSIKNVTIVDNSGIFKWIVHRDLIEDHLDNEIILLEEITETDIIIEIIETTEKEIIEIEIMIEIEGPDMIEMTDIMIIQEIEIMTEIEDPDMTEEEIEDSKREEVLPEKIQE